MKTTWSCLVSTVQSGGGGVMVWGYFLAHFGPLSTNWASFKRHSLPEYCCWPCPSLYDNSVLIFQWLLPAGYCTMSRSSNYLRLVSWTWQWVHFTQMASTFTRSQSNRAPLGCGGMGHSQQLRDAIMSIWTKISEEYFQHLVKSMPRRFKALLKAKGGPTRYYQGVPNKVAIECKQRRIFTYILKEGNTERGHSVQDGNSSRIAHTYICKWENADLIPLLQS